MLLRIFPAIAVLIAFLPATLRADDAAIAKQLESLGGKVTLKAGAANAIELKTARNSATPICRHRSACSPATPHSLRQCHGLTDATFAHLTILKELESIGTDGAQLTDEGLKQYASLTNLRSASFFHESFGMKGFTGVGFGYLKDCPKLERLTVAGISMGDEGFRRHRDHHTTARSANLAHLPNRSRQHRHREDAKSDRPADGPSACPVPGRTISLSDASIPIFEQI